MADQTPVRRIPSRGSLAERKRDQRVKYAVTQLRTHFPHLRNRPGLLPQLKSYVRITLLIERGYERIRNDEILGADGEIRSSVDTLRRLMLTQSHLARELGIGAMQQESMAQMKPEVASQF